MAVTPQLSSTHSENMASGREAARKQLAKLAAEAKDATKVSGTFSEQPVGTTTTLAINSGLTTVPAVP